MTRQFLKTTSVQSIFMFPLYHIELRQPSNWIGHPVPATCHQLPDNSHDWRWLWCSHCLVCETTHSASVTPFNKYSTVHIERYFSCIVFFVKHKFMLCNLKTKMNDMKSICIHACVVSDELQAQEIFKTCYILPWLEGKFIMGLNQNYCWAFWNVAHSILFKCLWGH